MYLRSNLKLLRKRKQRTQDEVATFLGMKRSTYSGYENGVAEPGIAELQTFSDYFGVAMDTLVRVDLQKISESQLNQLLEGVDPYIRGSRLRILSTTVNSENRENIELVNEKAQAGYRRGYADPEYIRELPVFQLPFLSPERKYRTFQISGDSMLPIPDGSYVTGEFVENWEYLKNGDPCIILTKDDGVVFKLIQKDFRRKQFILHSLNKVYDSFQVAVEEIAEIWKFVHYISSEMPDPLTSEQELYQVVANLKDEVEKLKEQRN
ncbi:MAG: helix-turn-helix transcriptional regulator [Bacteroidales bacterium]|nr:helix-turn-helix transcriptional regulator [Bacteroidales bacterium]